MRKETIVTDSNKPKTIYVVAMGGYHGCNLVNGDVGYYSYQAALDRVKAYHQRGCTWMKVYTVTMQDVQKRPHVESV